MIRRPPLGLLLFCLLAVAAALLAGAAIVLVAVDRAERQFETVLDEKALSRALRVRRDIDLALGLRIPLAEIRGMWDYTAQIPAADPDIRFVAVTDAALQRLYYGGIGKERLDPLLADPSLEAAARASLKATVTPADAVTIGGFSIVTLPLLKDGEPVGFVLVAAQRKQLRERLYAQAGKGAPLTGLALLLVLELAGFAYAAGYREPLQRLGWLLEAAERSDGKQFELSGRHAGGELGAAMFRFNALMHRAGRRSERFLSYADEVRRAVFEPSVAAQVAAQAEQAEWGAGAGRGPQMIRRSDARPSDLWPALVLGLLVAAAVPIRFAGLEAWAALAGVLAIELAGLAAALLLLPVGLGLIAVPVLVVLAAVMVGTAALAPWLLLGLAGGLLVGLAGRYARGHGLRLRRLWLALRLLVGLACGLLASAAAGLIGDSTVMAGLAVALALGAASMLLRPAVFRLAFASRRGVSGQSGEAD
ncbi:hypothetical protein SAMN06265365_14025 [Tistlia consotensis]|uniref:Uncharacterized protein n=1 Tax=Tistlia consotensis USBA 355 TaxID=560819 RepID=A0A1Y6CPN2_9PROT|nr:hypothetical protein [Tistlia consotensis]SMF81243.1 hypothetical protein SAMN05428998_14313 [Tistlia consotensis USBA 355]SNS23215.1 hypothetical protein SAMN06265365_14025 [Tistlia consotensis]